MHDDRLVTLKEHHIYVVLRRIRVYSIHNTVAKLTYIRVCFSTSNSDLEPVFAGRGQGLCSTTRWTTSRRRIHPIPMVYPLLRRISSLQASVLSHLWFHRLSSLVLQVCILRISTCKIIFDMTISFRDWFRRQVTALITKRLLFSYTVPFNSGHLRVGP